MKLKVPTGSPTEADLREMAAHLARGYLRHLALQRRCGVSGIQRECSANSVEFSPQIPLTGPHGLTAPGGDRHHPQIEGNQWV